MIVELESIHGCLFSLEFSVNSYATICNGLYDGSSYFGYHLINKLEAVSTHLILFVKAFLNLLKYFA